jgi:hypothetical protein
MKSKNAATTANVFMQGRASIEKGPSAICAIGFISGRNRNDETVRNLTRRWKASRLQDGIDRYIPIGGRESWHWLVAIDTFLQSNRLTISGAIALMFCVGRSG